MNNKFIQDWINLKNWNNNNCYYKSTLFYYSNFITIFIFAIFINYFNISYILNKSYLTGVMRFNRASIGIWNRFIKVLHKLRIIEIDFRCSLYIILYNSLLTRFKLDQVWSFESIFLIPQVLYNIIETWIWIIPWIKDEL